MSVENPAAHGPNLWIKLFVSLLVVAQFFVIFTVVTSAGTPNFPASPVAQELAGYTRPYAQAFFMHNAYRFYAPEPGPTNLLWVRYHYADGSSRWQELPRLQDFNSRIPYQRMLALLLMLGMTEMKVAVSSEGVEGSEALSDPLAVVRSKYSPIGRICVQSFVRHLALQPEYHRSLGQNMPLSDVEMYHVLHHIPAPDHAKLGWPYEHPHLYSVNYVGTYTPDGKLLPGEPGYLQTLQIEEVFAYRVVERDFLGFLDSHRVKLDDDVALNEAMERFGMPQPFRWPILRDRSLLQPQPREQLRTLFEQVLLQAEKPGARLELANPPRGASAGTGMTSQSPGSTKPTGAVPKSVPNPSRP